MMVNKPKIRLFKPLKQDNFCTLCWCHFYLQMLLTCWPYFRPGTLALAIEVPFNFCNSTHVRPSIHKPKPDMFLHIMSWDYVLRQIYFDKLHLIIPPTEFIKDNFLKQYSDKHILHVIPTSWMYVLLGTLVLAIGVPFNLFNSAHFWLVWPSIYEPKHSSCDPHVMGAFLSHWIELKLSIQFSFTRI